MRHQFSKTLAGVVLGAATVYAGQAGAAGFAIIEHSAQGMGNSFAGGGAVAEDASSVWFNPASITRLQNQIQTSGHLILPSFEFTGQSATDATGRAIAGRTNIDGGQDAVVPNLYWVQKLDGPFSLGLSINAPFGLATEYDRNWAGRYQAVESEIRTIHVNPAIAYKATDRLSIGGGLNVQYIDATLSSAVDFRSACLGVAAATARAGNLAGAGALNAACGPTPSGALDGFGENEADDISFGFNIGMFYELSERTRFSLAYRSKIKHQLDGDITFSLPNNATILGTFGTAFGRDGITANVSMPDSLSFSAYHRFHDKFGVMADATWTGWSSVQRLVIQFDNPNALRGAATVEELQWDDAWRLGLGLNYYHNDRLTLRTGVALDQTPAGGANVTTARLPDADRLWVSAGASYAVNNKIKLDLGYAHLFVDDASINRVGSQQDTLVGNFESSADIISVQFNYIFD